MSQLRLLKYEQPNYTTQELADMYEALLAKEKEIKESLEAVKTQTASIKDLILAEMREGKQVKSTKGVVYESAERESRRTSWAKVSEGMRSHLATEHHEILDTLVKSFTKYTKVITLRAKK